MIAMSIDTLIDILTILLGAGGVASLIVAARRIKSQNSLDISTAWEKFSKPLMQRLDDLEKKVKMLENENSDLRDWATRLYKQALDHGIKKPEQFIRHNYEDES